MNKMFAQQIGRNVQVYVNDMLVKSWREEDHLKDLKETFNTLRSYNMKLNLGKCAFGVTVGKFLGFMVSQRGKPKQDPSYYGDGATKKCEGSAKPQRKNSGAKQVRVRGDGQVFALLPNTKEIIRVDLRMPASVRRVEDLSLLPTAAEPVTARRRVFSLSSRLPRSR